MYIVTLILLGLWNGVLGSETACQVRAERDCPDRTLEGLEGRKLLPQYYEELVERCRDFSKRKQCVKDSVKKCLEEGADDLTVDKGALERLKENKRMDALFEELCKTDSVLQKKFVQDMYCLSHVTEVENKEHTCDDYAGNVRAHLQTRIDEKLKNQQDYLGRHPIYSCLEVLADMNCFLSKYNDQCGTRAKNTALELIEKGSSLDVQCPQSVRIDILELVDAWKSISKKGVFIRELILSDI